MTPFAAGPGWTVYQADARDLVAELGPTDHLVTDPPYMGPPTKGSGTHARRRRKEHDAADPSVIRDLVSACGTSIVVTGSTASTTTILELLPRATRVLPILRPGGQAGSRDPWLNGTILAHVYGFRDRAGRGVRAGYFLLPALDGRKEHVAELPVALGAWLSVGVPAGGRVVDPYAGSGALVLGARRLGLDVVAGDIDAGYCRRIADRHEAEPLALFPEAVS